MSKPKKLQNVAVLAIFLFVAIMAIGDFGGLFAISTYGGATQFYLAGANTPADTIQLTGSRSNTEVLATCPSAEHRIRITRSSDGVNYNDVSGGIKRVSIGAITKSANGNYLFGDGSSATAFRFEYVPTASGDYQAFESIQCSGTDITNIQRINFKVSARPTATPTIVKYCSNLGMNEKTRSCYYRTCEVKSTGNWDWSAEKQSSSFCDYVPPVTPPTTPPACTPNWVTSEWSQCIDSVSTRMVTDNNNCANPSTTPPTTEKACEMPVILPPVDNSNETTDLVSWCKMQKISGTDIYYGGYDASANRCTKAGASDTIDFVSAYKYYIVGAIILLAVWASGLIYVLAGKKKR